MLAGDVLEAIAERYLKRINCPAKHAGLYSRAEYIVCQVKENQADGVIFVYQKFCDPHAFDYPYIKKMLDEKGIPSLLIEIENQIPSEGQFKTRVEAFIEMLGPESWQEAAYSTQTVARIQTECLPAGMRTHLRLADNRLNIFYGWIPIQIYG